MACDEPCTDSKTRLILSRERFALASLRNGHLEMPCCLQMRFIVVGQTAQEERGMLYHVRMFSSNTHFRVNVDRQGIHSCS
jgi:hypothetical protein